MSEQRRIRDVKQAGWLMAGLVVVVAIMVIFSAVAFQAWADVLRRDSEAEMIFRAQDLVRAIQRYRRDHGGLGPEKMEQLMEPGPKGQYYLRRLWEDPLVDDGVWGILYSGPGGAIIDPAAMQEALGGGFDPSFSDQLKSKGKHRAGNRSLMNRPNRQAQEGRQQENSTGLRIAGVKSLCKEEPFRVYRNQSEYAMWLFTYLDLEQQLATVPPGQSVSNPAPPK